MPTGAWCNQHQNRIQTVMQMNMKGTCATLMTHSIKCRCTRMRRPLSTASRIQERTSSSTLSNLEPRKMVVEVAVVTAYSTLELFRCSDRAALVIANSDGKGSWPRVSSKKRFCRRTRTNQMQQHIHSHRYRRKCATPSSRRLLELGLASCLNHVAASFSAQWPQETLPPKRPERHTQA